MHPFALQFAQSGETRRINSYNVLRRKIRKPVLLRLRLAASEKPVLNALHPRASRSWRRGREHGTDNAAPRAAARCL